MGGFGEEEGGGNKVRGVRGGARELFLTLLASLLFRYANVRGGYGM